MKTRFCGGKRATDISHAGEELKILMKTSGRGTPGYAGTATKKTGKHDRRLRSWNLVMVEKSLGAEYTQPRDSVLQEKRQKTRYEEVPIVDGDAFITSAYVRQGLMPSTPHHASAVITVFVRGLCNLHVVAPHPYLDVQFSTAFDVYLSLGCSRLNMKAALGRHPNWRLKKPAPTCLYELEGEPKLKRRGFELEEGEGGDEGAGCEERWENMKEDVTARAWGLYDETGIFPALCRHGFVLVVVDMVQSGELAKYGLSVINHLIRCWVKTHPRLSVLAADNFKAVVGSFHGLGRSPVQHLQHGDVRRRHGLGGLRELRELLCKVQCPCRHDTLLHRLPPPAGNHTYMHHTDLCDAYQGLTIVIGNKYRRALKIKQGLPALHDTMRALNVSTRDVFETWLAKEKEYLQSMKKEPVEETNEMEYYQKLVNLHNSDQRVCPRCRTAYAKAAKQTRRLETQRRHTGEVAAKSLAAVQDLELRLGIETHWVAGGEEWVKAALMGLIVARMFELAKMNMSGTGYKLRKHIAKALQVRSKAVKTALQKYNDAAAAMDPPKPHLAGERRYAARDEEIERLNLEIPRLLTYMADERKFLIHHEERLQGREHALAHQRLHERRVPVDASEQHLKVTLRCWMPRCAHLRTPEHGRGEDEEDEDDMDTIVEAFENIVRIAHDTEAAAGAGGGAVKTIDGVDGVVLTLMVRCQ
ncbi:hypothetical protein B0H14DRAFT_2654322 [Mycena olivaceomarginata]|nr:hypothetical protein B0H14DRAFT_2654322 [Mycena olivaceomarginata]